LGRLALSEPKVPIRWCLAAGGSQLLRLLMQAVKFGIVGIAATLTHVTAFVSIVQTTGAAPLRANSVAFGVAFIVSFLGHFWWTFKASAAAEISRAAAALRRFLVVALIGFLLNTATVFLVVDVLALAYTYAVILMVTLVPACVFMMSRFWAFSPSHSVQ
jgi:putative flippase GtrA